MYWLKTICFELKNSTSLVCFWPLCVRFSNWSPAFALKPTSNTISFLNNADTPSNDVETNIFRSGLTLTE